MTHEIIVNLAYVYQFDKAIINNLFMNLKGKVKVFGVVTLYSAFSMFCPFCKLVIEV